MCHVLTFYTHVGIKLTGRITYVTMGLPIILLFLFLIGGATLEGSSDGIRAYIGEWDLTVLTEKGEIWSEAVSQIFFSLSVTFGVMTAYSSHMKREEPAFTNSLVVALANSMFSFIAGFAVFSAIGHKAFIEGKDISELDNLTSFGLVFGT
jgi:SNF family Na+-dependent transporter